MNPYFKGKGTPAPQDLKLPEVDLSNQGHGSGYRASSDLAAAVDVAITLGMPLLLTGEPGSGKSRLADAVAWELNLLGPLRFAVKSDTRATDLFYRFDTVGRFHASKTDGEDKAPPQRFIKFEALGQALLHAKPLAFLTSEIKLPERLKIVEDHRRTGRGRAVVLIDEIDKAPRDVPNDILTEIEDMAFRIPEFEVADGKEVRVALESSEFQYRPIVIITSNSERNLPDAFLRRCVYFHLTPPPFEQDQQPGSEETTIEEICRIRLGSRYTDNATLAASALALFRHLRETHLAGRTPGLAELLNFLNFILPDKLHGLDGGKPLNRQIVARAKVLNAAKTTLLKERELQEQAESLLADWLPKS